MLYNLQKVKYKLTGECLVKENRIQCNYFKKKETYLA